MCGKHQDGQTVLGVHLLKEMFNLTDDEALEQLEFNLLWRDIEETHLPQKTLHNFRVRLAARNATPPTSWCPGLEGPESFVSAS